VEAAAVTALEFAHPALIHLVWPALALTALLVVRELGRGAALGGQLSAVMQRRLVSAPGRRRRLARAGLVLATLVFGVLALMRPQVPGATEVSAGSRIAADLVIVLDVSRSMLAEDAAPSRLARAKAEVASLVERLAGHRVGLVAFAGRAVTASPLTPDYGFFKLVLDGVDTRTVSRGGTHIGDGIRKALEAFGPDSPSGARLVLLITDGEDHDSRPLEAAKAAKAAGVRIVSIGFGSEQGSQITVTDPDTGARSVVTDGPGGPPVVSRLDGELLRQIALETDGAYVPAGTAALDLESIVAEHLTPMVRAQRAGVARRVVVERYPWFVLAALFALAGVAYLGGAPAERRIG
jgi:Ca-activated chloride channel family protein